MLRLDLVRIGQAKNTKNGLFSDATGYGLNLMKYSG
jgi:hypothetical protein